QQDGHEVNEAGRGEEAVVDGLALDDVPLPNVFQSCPLGRLFARGAGRRRRVPVPPNDESEQPERQDVFRQVPDVTPTHATIPDRRCFLTAGHVAAPATPETLHSAETGAGCLDGPGGGSG